MPDDKTLYGKTELALQGGMTTFQYRDKQLGNSRRLEQAQKLKALCQRYDVPLIINDDIELAKAVQADGVHLGKDDSSQMKARRILGNHAIVGISCYNNLALARQAVAEGANYVAFGAVFPSSTKSNAKPVSLSVIAEAIEQLPVPVVPIGGINKGNVAQLKALGANNVAVIAALFGAKNVCTYAATLSRILCTHD